jgi:Domain of unknown function (DUF4148)
MKNRLMIATTLVALLGAGSAFAAEGTQDFQPSSIQSTKSRADVKAELAAAQRDGTLETRNYGEASAAPKAASTLSRAQVVAETREALRLGLLDRYDGYAPEPTAAQLEQIRQAGMRAVSDNVAAVR